MALDSILSTPVIPPPPKGATSPTTGGSSGGDSSSSSTTASSASDSGAANAASDSSGSAARNSSKPVGMGQGNSTSRNAKSSAAAQSGPSSSKARQSSATSQTQANSTSYIPRALAKNPGPSFIEALAQTQADAQDSPTATAAGAPQEVTGAKPKGAKDDHSDTTGTALGILSQSLAAAMAGLQPANPGQSPQTTSDDDSTDTVSLAGGGSATIQSVVANIAQGAAEELAHGSSGLKAATTTIDGKADPAAPATDNTAAAASAFQAHMVSRAQSTANADALNGKVNTPVGDAGFAGEVGDKITWMANQGVQSASLQLTPEHLGPVEVRISVKDGSASVSFNAAHADTRAALEQTLPRLREMFSTQGLTLTDASVSQQSPRGQPQRHSAIGAIGGVSGDDSTSSVTSVTRVQLGLVDTYA